MGDSYIMDHDNIEVMSTRWSYQKPFLPGLKNW
jgi:hypothetical protein